VIGAEVRPAAVLSEDGYPLCDEHASVLVRRWGLELGPFPADWTGPTVCWACSEASS
jgi:hypothetical protein